MYRGLIRRLVGVTALSTLGAHAAVAQDIKFKNVMDVKVAIHMRIGPVEKGPDDRGSANSEIDVGVTLTENVSNGDIWYAYSPRGISGSDNPVLCNAKGGEVVELDGTGDCFVP